MVFFNSISTGVYGSRLLNKVLLVKLDGNLSGTVRRKIGEDVAEASFFEHEFCDHPVFIIGADSGSFLVVKQSM